MNRSRLLYLGFALPPGGRTRHPGINPAGNAFEAQMIDALRSQLEIKSAGCLPFEIQAHPDGDPLSGIDHDLTIVEKAPELWHRRKALAQLKKYYRRLVASGWMPDTVLAYNFSPIYNQFIRWLHRQTPRPELVLLLLDSSQLGENISASKKFRYAFKPFAILDETMLDEFDACIGLSAEVEKYAVQHRLKFLWMPGACTPSRAPTKDPAKDISGPIRFCYFGALAAHAGVTELARTFLTTTGDSELHLCGYGKQAAEIESLARQSNRIQFHGLLPRPEDCLTLGQSCDVLVNPRPPGYGNENNVPSKLFDYALCGRAILSSRMSGIEKVFGPEAFYFETAGFEQNLREAILQVAAIPRAELHRKGEAISQRVKEEFNWARQTERMAGFLENL